jgi:succinate dehydrogenase/fumarate reductase flavoprotein subunit
LVFIKRALNECSPSIGHKEEVLKHFYYDVLVMGSGGAGLRAAIGAREKGVEVCVISKGTPGKMTSTILSGGAFAGAEAGASQIVHLESTLQAGRGINQQELAEILVEEAPSRLRELRAWGVQSEIQHGYLFSKGRPPIWGDEIMRCLLAKAKSLGVQLMGGLEVTHLELQEGRAGAVAYSALSDSWFTFASKTLVLATGGAGALFLRHDNPRRMLGEGYFLALEAGALLQDMEFVQFYPLGLAEPGAPPFLITPRLADSGRLVNGQGEEILEKYGIHERPAALRARDRLSQALFKEIYREGEAVFVDLQGLTQNEWQVDPLSASTKRILEERYGAMRRPVRVAPMAHFTIGGVCIDAQGATSVPGLFAAGEVTGGLHGANRMGGNALTETQVFGTRAGEAAAAWAKNMAGPKSRWSLEKLDARVSSFTSNKTRSNIQMDLSKLKRTLGEILWKDGGILRNRQGLTQALDAIEVIQAEALELSLGDNARGVQQILELQLASRTAAVILEGALRREESRGAHFREDFPDQDDEHWQGHLQVQLSPKGKQIWTYQPIHSKEAT